MRTQLTRQLLILGLMFLSALRIFRPQKYQRFHDLGQIVAQTVKPYEIILGQRNIQLELEVPSILVYTYPLFLREILDHLLSNAIKYADVAKPVQQIKIYTETSSDELTVIIQDNGLGIMPPHQDKIFNWFYRGEKNATWSLGIGLAVVRYLCSQLNLRYGFSSETGQGSLFWVILPTV